MDPEQELAEIETAMLHHEQEHRWHMEEWHRLQAKRVYLLPLVTEIRLRRQDLQEARRHMGSKTRESEAA
ncbi:MAG: hypothetical protein QM692_09305 [Thermomicrobiales bacterium]